MASKIPNNFLYFVQGGDVCIDKAVRATLDDRLVSWNAKAGTLFDREGALVTPVMMPGHLERVAESAQTWVESSAHPGLWVGMWDDHRPTAEDLKRPEGVLGAPIKMLNGEVYTLPLLMYDTGKGPEHRLPSRMVYRGGEWQTFIREEYRAIGEQSLGIYDAIADTMQATNEKRKPRYELTVKQCADFAAAGLSVNYRIGKEEIGLLGIFDPAMALHYAGAMVGKNMLSELLEIAEGRKGLGELV